MSKRTISVLAIIMAMSAFCLAQGGFGFRMASINGSVRTLDNQPVTDAQVLIHSLMTGQTLSAGSTSLIGTFNVDQLPQGTYEVVVRAGLDEVRQTVTVRPGEMRMLTLRMPRNPTSNVGNGTMVSVQQFQVPKKARKFLKKAESAIRKGEYEEAGKHIENALQEYPNFAEALTLRGIMKLEAKNFEGARNDLEQAVENDGSYAKAYIVLGATYNLLSRFDDAARTIDRGLALSPMAWQGYFEMGKAMLGKGDFSQALRQFSKAERLAPKQYGPVHLAKAHALLGLKNYRAATAELEAYLERDPKGVGSDSARQTLDQVKAFMASGGK